MDNQVNQPFGTQPPQSENKCSNCGASIAPEQAFCATCGTAAPASTSMPTTPQANICSSCGNELPADAEFCAHCGHRKENTSFAGDVNPAIAQYNTTVATATKSKKKIIIPIVVGVVAIVAIIIGILVSNSIKEQKIQEARADYIENAEEFASVSLTAGANLEDIADTIQQYWYNAIWKDYYYGDIDIAISRALSDKSSAISTASSYDSQMKSLYNQLRYIPEGLEDDYEIKELNQAIKNLYNIYTDFYDFATDPSGSYNSFSEANGDKTDDYVAAYKALSNLVN